MMSDQPKKSTAGLYAVSRRENFIYWDAWRCWYHAALGKGFFPDTMTVFLEFPPETQEAANFVAAQINDIRRQIKWSQMVPERPVPWRRWTPTEMNGREALEREYLATESTIAPERARAVAEAARTRYYRHPKLRVVESASENPTLAARYRPSAEELAERERNLVEQRRAWVNSVMPNEQ